MFKNNIWLTNPRSQAFLFSNRSVPRMYVVSPVLMFTRFTVGEMYPYPDQTTDFEKQYNGTAPDTRNRFHSGKNKTIAIYRHLLRPICTLVFCPTLLRLEAPYRPPKHDVVLTESVARWAIPLSMHAIKSDWKNDDWSSGRLGSTHSGQKLVSHPNSK